MSLYVLVTGVVIGGFHIYVSRMLRGNSMPVDAVVYTTALTLIVFLLLRIPFIWNHADFEKGESRSNRMAGGAAAILLGLMTLTIQYTMGPTHTWNDVNYANAFNEWMTITGVGLLLLGVRWMGWLQMDRARLMSRFSSLRSRWTYPSG